MITRTNRWITVCCSLLFLLLLFIWGNSLLPGNISGAFSDRVNEILTGLFPFLFSGADVSAGGGLLRKLAHFTEFAALGACFSWLYAMLRPGKKEQLLLSVISGFVIACADETIQRFVPERHGCLTDVGIDIAGVAAGIVLFTFTHFVIKKINNTWRK